MAYIIANIGTFSPTSSDLSHNSALSCQMGKDVIPQGNITGITVYLSSLRTYVSDCYLIITKGTATLTTGVLANNSATHADTVNATSFNNDWLPATAGTLSITVKRTGGGGGAAVNFRDGITGEITITYDTGERIFIRKSGVWRKGKVWRKVAGVWRQGYPFINKSGVWKAGK